MNEKVMTICLRSPKLIVEYACGIIARTEVDDKSGDVVFLKRNGEVIVHNVSHYVVPEHVYLSQYGLSVTDDGKYFFVQSWEKGLFCFDLQSGCLAWHCKTKRATDLVVLKDSVICHFLEQSVCALDLSTGENLHRVPLGYATCFFTLTEDYYLIGPKRYVYHVIDSSLRTVARIPMTALNPKSCSYFIMLRADVEHGGIRISGFEHPPVAGKMPPPEQCRFSRYVPVDIPGLTT